MKRLNSANLTRRYAAPYRTVALLALGAMTLTACAAADGAEGADDGEQTGESADTITMAFVPKAIHPWYDDVEIGIQKAIDELAAEGVTLEYEWFAPQSADVAQWTQRIEAAIQSHPDYLSISCLDPDAGVPLIEEAVAAGITVFTFDTPCSESAASTFVGHADSTEDGYLMGKALAEELGGEGKVAILAGSPGAVNHEQRVTGFTTAMDEHPGMEIVAQEFDNDSLEEAINLTQSILQAHPDVTGIFGANASAPVGAGQAVVEADKVGEVVVVGMDDLPETLDLVRDGVILAIAVQHVQEIGYWSAMFAADDAAGKEIAELKETGSFAVTKENVDSYK